MSETYDYGEPDEYEITWKSGHIDRLLAHQITWPDSGIGLSLFGGTRPDRARIVFHAEIDGKWRLMLSAFEDEIATVRNVTQVGDRP